VLLCRETGRLSPANWIADCGFRIADFKIRLLRAERVSEQMAFHHDQDRRLRGLEWISQIFQFEMIMNLICANPFDPRHPCAMSFENP
jgi:hypothetical protein